MAIWKLWIVLGVVLAILEVVLPAQFLLVALGVCAILVGLLTWAFDLSHQAQLAWSAGLAIVLVPAFVYLWRRRVPVRYPGTAGEAGSAPQLGKVVSVDPLFVLLHGDRYPADSLDGTELHPGDVVRIEKFSGITASVRKVANR